MAHDHQDMETIIRNQLHGGKFAFFFCSHVLGFCVDKKKFPSPPKTNNNNNTEELDLPFCGIFVNQWILPAFSLTILITLLPTSSNFKGGYLLLISQSLTSNMKTMESLPYYDTHTPCVLVLYNSSLNAQMSDQRSEEVLQTLCLRRHFAPYLSYFF